MSLQGERLGPCASPFESTARTVVLVVGDATGDLHELQGDEESFAFVPIDQIDAGLIATLEPDIVLSPLLAGSFDCFDLAMILSSSGFHGAYRAVARDLPSPGIVKREIANLCPDLDFDLIRPVSLNLI